MIDNNMNGIVIPVGDVNALSDAIEKVMWMSAIERECMADAARAKVLDYCSRENSIDALCRIIDEGKVGWDKLYRFILDPAYRFKTPDKRYLQIAYRAKFGKTLNLVNLQTFNKSCNG